jgi:hypothetical protein
MRIGECRRQRSLAEATVLVLSATNEDMERLVSMSSYSQRRTPSMKAREGGGRTHDSTHANFLSLFKNLHRHLRRGNDGYGGSTWGGQCGQRGQGRVGFDLQVWPRWKGLDRRRGRVDRRYWETVVRVPGEDLVAILGGVAGGTNDGEGGGREEEAGGCFRRHCFLGWLVKRRILMLGFYGSLVSV